MEENGSSHLTHQVQYLTDTLRDAHQLMKNNQKLLASQSSYCTNAVHSCSNHLPTTAVRGGVKCNDSLIWDQYQGRSPYHDPQHTAAGVSRCTSAPVACTVHVSSGQENSHRILTQTPPHCCYHDNTPEEINDYDSLQRQIDTLKDNMLKKEEELKYRKERDHLLDQLCKMEKERYKQPSPCYRGGGEREKLKQYEEEVTAFAQRLAQTEEEIKQQNDKLIKKDFEKGVQLQKCQSVIMKLECELCEALENLKQLSVEKMDLTSEVNTKERWANELYEKVNEMLKKNKVLQNRVNELTAQREEDETSSYCTSSHTTTPPNNPPNSTHMCSPCKCVSSPTFNQSPPTCNLTTNTCRMGGASINNDIRGNLPLSCKCIPSLAKTCHVKNDTSKVDDGHREEISSLKDQILQLKMQLLDEKSMLDIVRQQNQEALVDHQKLGSDLNKSLEDSEKLRRKYVKAKRQFEEKTTLLEETITEAHCHEMDTLRQQLIEMECSYTEQLHEQEGQLGSINREIDCLITTLGGKSTQISSSLLKITPSIIMTKISWLWKEVTSLKQKQEELQKTLKEQQNTNMILRAKLGAFNEELLSGPSKQTHHQFLHQTI